MKPIILELIPLAVLGFAWYGIKNMDKKSGSGGVIANIVGRIKWQNWIIMLMIVLALALVITKAFL